MIWKTKPNILRRSGDDTQALLDTITKLQQKINEDRDTITRLSADNLVLQELRRTSNNRLDDALSKIAEMKEESDRQKRMASVLHHGHRVAQELIVVMVGTIARLPTYVNTSQPDVNREVGDAMRAVDEAVKKIEFDAKHVEYLRKEIDSWKKKYAGESATTAFLFLLVPMYCLVVFFMIVMK